MRAHEASPDEYEMRDARPKDSRPSNEEMLRLKEEASQLKAELARLKNETSKLRTETVRLKDQFALRDAGPLRKSEGKVDPMGRVLDAKAPVPTSEKGDLQTSGSQKTEIPNTAHDVKSENRLSDEREPESRTSAAARAWKELVELAARIKKGLSGDL